MRKTNRFAPRPATTTAMNAGFGVPCCDDDAFGPWMAMSDVRRREVIRAANPARYGEAPIAYESRVRRLVGERTTREVATMHRAAGLVASGPKYAALAAAGSVGKSGAKLAALGVIPAGGAAPVPPSILPGLGLDPLGLGSALTAVETAADSATADDSPTGKQETGGTGKDQGGTGWTAQDYTRLGNTIGGLLGRGADVVIAAIESGDRRAIAQIQADAMIRLRELQNEAAGSSDPAARDAITQQVADLTAAVAALAARSNGAPPPSTGMTFDGKTVAMIAGGVVLVGALAYFVMRRRPRGNPVMYERGPHGMRPTRFIAARHL